MKRKIASLDTVNCDLAELQGFLKEMFVHAHTACSGNDWRSGASSIHIEDVNGEELAEVALIEETLTDGSKVYNVVLRFSNTEVS